MTGHVEKRTGASGKPRWRALLYVGERDGGPRRESVGTYATRTEALAAIDARRDQLRGGSYAGERLTVAQLLRRWLADSVKARVRPGSYAHYEHEVRRIEAAPLGDILASRLIGADVDAYLATLASGGREDGRAGGLSAKTRSHLRITLGSAFRWATRAGLIARNPIADTEPIAVPAPEHAALSIEQLAQVLGALRGTRLEAAAILAAFGGLRRGESLAVRWCDISASGVHIERQVVYERSVRRVLIAELKTGASRGLVPLPPHALAMLDDLRRRRAHQALVAGRPFSGDELCTQRADGRPVNPDNAGAQFTHMLERKGLPGVHLHMLRHAYGSELAVRQNVDARTVQRLMRHADVATTLRHYVDSDAGAQQAAAERLGEAWEREAASRHHSGTKDADIVDLAARRGRKGPA